MRSEISLALFIFILSFNVSARNSTLPILKTKSDIKDIRYITKDGKFTYYQRRSGTLLLSTNYKVKEILKAEVGSQFTIHSSSSNKKIIITVDDTFHTYLGLRHLKRIYVNDIGSEEVREIGKGHSPKLHLNDTWMSWFNPYTRNVSFINIKSPTLNFKVKIKNTLNAYFRPDVVMLNEKEVLYTDINNKGIPAILQYSRKLKRVKAIFKSASSSQRIELCKNDKSLFVGEFGFNNSPRGSIIAKVNLKKFNIDKADIVYQSRMNDFGNIKCSFKKDHLYFIKNISKIGGRVESEVNAFNHVKKSSRIISDLKYVSQLLAMDGRLLVPFRGVFYVLEGDTDLTTVGLLKKNVDNTPIPEQTPDGAPVDKPKNEKKEKKK
ncbi:MAG: hypothetical protein KC493_02210 [Bacteriovoracaceae bacterium]|nr:hypothetical protein [Bacteriovoracaceae bacterium]